MPRTNYDEPYCFYVSVMFLLENKTYKRLGTYTSEQVAYARLFSVGGPHLKPTGNSSKAYYDPHANVFFIKKFTVGNTYDDLTVPDTNTNSTE